MAALEQGYEKTSDLMEKDNHCIQDCISDLKSLLDCFAAVMEETPESLIHDADDPYYAYLKEVFDGQESHASTSFAEKNLIFKARLETGLQRFLRDVGPSY